jgi:uncharacterized membrane protein
MDTPNQTTPHTAVEELEDAAEVTGTVVVVALRAVEIGAAVLLGLLVVPPLLILTFLVVAPLVALAVVVSLVAAIFAAPYLLVRHLRGHHVPHASVFARRVRHAVRAIAGLLPHHVVREARRDPGA